MKNESANYLRQIATATKPKTTAVASQGRKFHSANPTNQRRRRNARSKTQVRAPIHVTDGFLKCAFLPKYAVNDQITQDIAGLESEFFQSLSMATDFYSVSLSSTKGFDYPYNAMLSLRELKLKLRWEIPGHVELGFGKDGINAVESYNTGMILYYIPVQPLYKLLQNNETKNSAQLLLLIFAYLYHVADIPYYRDENTYLFWQYEMIEDCMQQELNDEENQEAEKSLAEIKTAKSVGDAIGELIWDRNILQGFQTSLQNFIPLNSFDHCCFELAKQAFNIYSDHPKSSVFIHADEKLDQEETITMDRYISFVADTDSHLYDTIQEYVNMEFNECSDKQDPVIRRLFKPQSTNSDSTLVFECRIFPLIENLCELLNNV